MCGSVSGLPISPKVLMLVDHYDAIQSVGAASTLSRVQRLFSIFLGARGIALLLFADLCRNERPVGRMARAGRCRCRRDAGLNVDPLMGHQVSVTADTRRDNVKHRSYSFPHRFIYR